MAKQKIQKGSEEFEFWGDLFKMRELTYKPDPKNESVDDFIEVYFGCANEIIFKYRECDFYPMVDKLMTAYCNYMEEVTKSVKEWSKDGDDS